MSAHSSPSHGPATRWGALVSSPTPMAFARRLAGSIVTTQARRPRRAASTANAAATVVLPTPPEPQHTTIDRSSTRSVSPAPAGPGSGGRSVDGVGRAASIAGLAPRPRSAAREPLGPDTPSRAAPGTDPDPGPESATGPRGALRSEEHTSEL